MGDGKKEDGKQEDEEVACAGDKGSVPPTKTSIKGSKGSGIKQLLRKKKVVQAFETSNAKKLVVVEEEVAGLEQALSSRPSPARQAAKSKVAPSQMRARPVQLKKSRS